MHVYVNWCQLRRQCLVFFFALCFLKWSREKWPRQWEKAHMPWPMTLANCSVFFLIIILGKTKDRSYPASLCIMTFSFRWNCPHKNGFFFLFKWIFAIFLFKSQASNLNDSFSILIYRSFHLLANNNRTVDRKNEHHALCTQLVIIYLVIFHWKPVA